MRDRYALNVPIVQSIDCKNPDGTFSSVSLTGNNLLGNGNSPYFTITRFPLYARIPSQEGFGSCVRDTNANESKIQESSNDIRIWLRGNGIHEDIDLLRDEQKISHPVDGIGHFHMHSETDYETDDGAEFCSYDKGCGLVDLGRYGPFHKKDRKTQLEFNIKDFIFDYEPAGEFHNPRIFTQIIFEVHCFLIFHFHFTMILRVELWSFRETQRNTTGD